MNYRMITIGESLLSTRRTHNIIIVAPTPSDSIVICFFIELEGRGGRVSLTVKSCGSLNRQTDTKLLVSTFIARTWNLYWPPDSNI